MRFDNAFVIMAETPVDAKSRAIKFINDLGWQIKLPEVQEATVPAVFDDVYQL